MQRKLIAVLVANLFVGGAALAQGFTLTGEVGVGGLIVEDKGADLSKLNEYRDMSNGVLSIIDLKGRADRYYMNFYGENLARDDMFLKLDGGMKQLFKYALWSDSLTHNFGFGMRSPYNGLGGSDPRAPVTYVPPPPATNNFFFISNAANPGSWNTYDLSYKRRNDGASVEVSFNTPFYVRADLGQVRFDGSKLQSFANGTSPGGGFTDFFVPVDYTTKNLSFEGGYSSKRMHIALNFLSSKYENDSNLFTWNNPTFANGIDAHPLPPDNDYTRWSANAVFKQLPLNSTFGVRYTTSKSESNVNLLTNVLNTGAGTPLTPTNPSSNAVPGSFNGDVRYDTYSLTLSSNPARIVDTRLYYNHFKKENESTRVTFNGLPAGLSCSDIFNATGPANCEPELFNYTKKNYGLDVGVRPFTGNKINLGYDFSDVERERFDTNQTDETRYSIEWRNSNLDWLSARVKYTRFERESNFQLTPEFVRARVAAEAAAGRPTNFNNTTQGFIEAFVSRFDVSNMDQDQYKIGLDFTLSETADLSFEYARKESKYRGVILGRTGDERDEFYVNAGFGDREVIRFNVFGGWETINYTSYHRVGNPLDPFLAPTTAAYNWGMGIRDVYRTFGAGFDWPAAERLMIKASALWQRTDGTGRFEPQTLASGASANPALLLGGINNYGNNEFFSLNVKGIWQFTPKIELTLGAAYEEHKFNDIQFNNYTYIVPTTAPNASTSYLSGWYANPDYKAGLGYVIVKYKF
jgi:hypothetical protein